MRGEWLETAMKANETVPVTVSQNIIIESEKILFFIYIALGILWIALAVIWILMLLIHRKAHAIRLYYLVLAVPLAKVFYITIQTTNYGLCWINNIMCKEYEYLDHIASYAKIPYVASLAAIFLLIALGWGISQRYISCLGTIFIGSGMVIAVLGYTASILLGQLFLIITLFIVGLLGYALLYKQVRLLRRQTIWYKSIDRTYPTHRIPSYQKYMILKIFFATISIFAMLRFFGWIIVSMIYLIGSQNTNVWLHIVSDAVLFDEIGELLCVSCIAITIRPRNFKPYDAFNRSDDQYGVDMLVQMDRNHRLMTPEATIEEEEITLTTTGPAPILAPTLQKKFRLAALEQTICKQIQAQQITSPIWQNEEQFQPALIVKHAGLQYPISIAAAYLPPCPPPVTSPSS